MATAAGKCLHAQFRAQAAATPDAAALVGPGGETSYRELDEASDRLAAALLRLGVSKNSSVGILMERCDEYALAYVGILKAGAGYAVLDVAYPESLLADVLEKARPAVVVCKRAQVARLPKEQTVLLLDSFEAVSGELSEDDQAALQAVDDEDLDSLAYVVFSSGTSGKPKGIAAPHRGAVFSYEWRYENIPYSTDEQEVEGCNVFFVWEMLRPLLRGAALCVIPDNVIYDPELLTNYLQKWCVTRCLFTPSLLEAVLDSKTLGAETLAARLPALRTVVLCGEVVTVALHERARELLPWAALWNLYSVSECHDVAALELTEGQYGGRKYCPVGRLFAGVEAYVMDDSLVERGTGEEGELYVAGPTLALRYLGQPELTAARFPTVRGVRMYKTGDRARVLHNRELEILGRCDSMVKVRGYSVELRAIEAAIMALQGLVTSCAVVVQGEEGEDKFVVAYLVLKEAASCRQVRLELKAKLPHYMVPAYMIELSEMPTHQVSGKLDKKALPPVDPRTGRAEGAAVRSRTVSTELDCTLPRTELETALHSAWCQVMGMQQIDVVYDSFFDIGGHSLLAARLVQAIKLDLKREVGVVDLFAHPTIEALARFLSGEPDDSAGSVKGLDLEREVEVFDATKAINDMAMRAFWRTTHFAQVRARSVLITGATGFLGSYLLYELLRDEHLDVVYCIVRASSSADVSALDRVRSALQAKGLWREAFEARVHAFTGDAALHHLGLEDDDYAALSTGVDLVLHCAASVNLVYPYEGLRAANVLGTRNMIEFALMGKVKRFGYVSTNGVFPDGLSDCREDDDVGALAGALASGYSQSKWVAEELVRRAGERGLPVVVFRPGNMAGDSGERGGSGAWNPSDTNFLFLTGCLELGAAPKVEGWLMEMTPVDVAAHAMVRLVQDNASIGSVFHVTNCDKSRSAEYCFDALRNLGYHLESLPYDAWLARLRASASPRLAKLRNAVLGFPSAASLAGLSTFDNTRFAERCKELDIVLPIMNSTRVHEYVEGWQRDGLVPAPAAPSRPLLGKVAMVTGASSGIGAAIARALSEAGAAVGVGGRRLERLEELARETAARTGGKVVCHAVDVTDRAGVKTFVKACEADLGPCDIFVNNAGVMHYTKLEHLVEDQWEKEVDVNCKGLLHGIAAVLPGMLERGKGHIIATSSDAGRKVFPGLSVYSGSKFFVEAVCQGLRLETAAQGLRVTTVQPGDCRTELAALTTDETARAEYAQASDSRELWLDPEDVARAVVFAAAAPAHVGVNEVLIEPRGAPA